MWVIRLFFNTGSFQTTKSNYIQGKFKQFNRKEERLDDFFFLTIYIDMKYSELADVVKIILTLSHGQASVERDFSLNKSIVVNQGYASQ